MTGTNVARDTKVSEVVSTTKVKFDKDTSGILSQNQPLTFTSDGRKPKTEKYTLADGEEKF